MNNKRKFNVLLKIILIMLYTYIYIANGKKIYLNDTYQCLEEMLGIFNNALIPYILFNIFSDFISDQNKRIVFLIRLNFFFVLLICLSNFQLLFYMKNLSKDNLEKKMFIFLYVCKNLGMLITMILYKIYFLLTIKTNLIVTEIVTIFSLFILFGKIIGNTIRKITKYYSKENREKRKKIKKLMEEKIKIKEKILEKEKRERIEKERQIIIEKKKEREIKKIISEIKKMNKES